MGVTSLGLDEVGVTSVALDEVHVTSIGRLWRVSALLFRTWIVVIACRECICTSLLTVPTIGTSGHDKPTNASMDSNNLISSRR